MNYFGYQSNTTGAIWGLFKSLGEVTPEQREKMYSGSEYSHTLETVSAALSGAIATDPESVNNFNLWGYEFSCANRDNLRRLNLAEHVLNIVDFSTTSDDSLAVGYGDISSRDLASKLTSKEDVFEDLVESISFEENLKQLLNIRSQYIVEQGVDVVSVLYGALKGIPDAINEVKTLVKDNFLKDLYAQLCEESQNGALLRRLEVVV